MNFDALIAAVSSGNQCDVGMSGITVNPERLKSVDFTDEYYISDISFIVNEKSSINSANAKYKIYDNSLRFAVQSGSTCEAYARENFPNAQIITYGTENDGFSAVFADQADIVCSTKAVAANLLKTQFSSMRDVLDIATGEEYAIAVCKDNPALTSALNDALSVIVADGTMQKLYAKYGITSGESLKANKLQTVKCTAKTNSMASNNVLGGLTTRIT